MVLVRGAGKHVGDLLPVASSAVEGGGHGDATPWVQRLLAAAGRRAPGAICVLQVVQLGRFLADCVPKLHPADEPVLDELGGQQSGDLGNVPSGKLGPISWPGRVGYGEYRLASSAQHPLSHNVRGLAGNELGVEGVSGVGPWPGPIVYNSQQLAGEPDDRLRLVLQPVLVSLLGGAVPARKAMQFSAPRELPPRHLGGLRLVGSGSPRVHLAVQQPQCARAFQHQLQAWRLADVPPSLCDRRHPCGQSRAVVSPRDLR